MQKNWRDDPPELAFQDGLKRAITGKEELIDPGVCKIWTQPCQQCYDHRDRDQSDRDWYLLSEGAVPTTGDIDLQIPGGTCSRLILLQSDLSEATCVPISFVIRLGEKPGQFLPRCRNEVIVLDPDAISIGTLIYRTRDSIRSQVVRKLFSSIYARKESDLSHDICPKKLKTQ